MVLYDIGVVSTKEPFKCVINQGIILGEASKTYLVNILTNDVNAVLIASVLNKLQIQYMASKDKDGKFVSADSIDASGNHKEERIADEKL
ncbi:hypothetical protein L2E82_30660 [Cichorium intybus]|uniref:Uncharacterized protein n=1 Tax=Cichorium intybus TaxID=13427 RepID=A0ACB9D104_CICIN|nr:hypothetical protein L2E82_30660 [Cichorium intybus]